MEEFPVGNYVYRVVNSKLFMNKPAQSDKQTLPSSDTSNCEIHCLIHLDNLRQVQPQLLPVAKVQQSALAS